MIFLDHYRTTSTSDQVYDRMLPFLQKEYYLPESFTKRGTQAAETIEQANQTILRSFRLKRGEVFYTSGATVANNVVISGVLRDRKPAETHIVCSVIDHPSIVNVYEYYKKKGFSVTFLKVDPEGMIIPEDLEKAITEKTALVCLTHVNHTIGSIQPLDILIPLIKRRNPNTLLLVDASMSINSLSIDLEALPIDFLTFSSHKIYGPKGVGAVVVRNPASLKPILFGSVSSSSFSPGAENIPGIVGICQALQDATEKREEYNRKMMVFQKRLIEQIENRVSHVFLNGARGDRRAVDNVNYSFRFVEGESIMMFLDFEDILVATGSACASSDLKVNYILSAIGRDHELSHGSIRITPGWDNDESQILQFLDKLVATVERLRSQSTIRP